MTHPLALLLVPSAVALAAALVWHAPPAPPAPQEDAPGYDDTPYLPEGPDGTWRVHDRARPYPDAVRPGDAGAPPSDAVVLFDGSDLEAWEGGPWKVEDGAMVPDGTGSIATREAFGDCQLHLEWRAPASPEGASQARGNSGVFLMGRYEVQILDSWENPTYADGQAAALYGQRPPLVNASRPPGAWQSYDVVFRAPRFDGGRLVEPARVTVLHNGVAVHHAAPFLGATRHREVARYEAHEAELPLVLQDHGDPVAFRNVWIRRL